jgi:hypothetical protein
VQHATQARQHTPPLPPRHYHRFSAGAPVREQQQQQQYIHVIPINMAPMAVNANNPYGLPPFVLPVMYAHQ